MIARRIQKTETKHLFVALQRLGENSLKKCLEKYGLKLARNSINPFVHRSQPYLKKTDGIKSEESTLGTPFKRRKRKIPVLCYSDEEDCIDSGNVLVNREISEDGLESRALSKRMCFLCATQKMNTKEVRKRGRKKPKESTLGGPYKRRKRKVPPLCYSEEDSNDSEDPLACIETAGEEESRFLSKTEHVKTCVLTKQGSREIKEEREINSRKTRFEVVGERGNVDKRQEENKVDVPKEFCKSTEAEMVISSESPNQSLQESEFEAREEDEDDRKTVIFEEELDKDTDLEVIVEEKEVVTKQLKNREITNRKKQRLVKFKRKSMTGRNSAKTRKPKSSFSEGAGSGYELAEKSTIGFSEDCLKEVCTLVKRLHELYRIILQLQRELPNNTELAVHFARVIHAQQENFHREIRKSQKTIIKCYEKMLTFYKSTNKVALEISKETFLSVEDIVSVISRCILVEEHCEGKETLETTGISMQRTINDASARSTSKKTYKTQTNFSIPKHVLSNLSKHPSTPSGDSSRLNEQPTSTHFHTDKLPSVVRSHGSLSAELPVRTCGTENHPGLDPTIPQKLTMRNHRLEAGPILSPTDEDVQVVANLPTGTNAENWGHRVSKSRVYVCAQNDCKNPGVRVCKRCYSVIYCSDTCQLKHWTLKHKVECYLLMELRK